MCETYGIDITAEGLDGDDPARPLFVAALCAQLPQRCRVNRAEDPDLAWSQEQWTLWRVEQWLQVLVQRGAKRPKKVRPMATPAMARRHVRAAESAGRSKARVDSILFGGE